MGGSLSACLEPMFAFGHDGVVELASSPPRSSSPLAASAGGEHVGRCVNAKSVGCPESLLQTPTCPASAQCA
jgi:hypothetical protein